jgi:hypothetical protein
MPYFIDKVQVEGDPKGVFSALINAKKMPEFKGRRLHHGMLRYTPAWKLDPTKRLRQPEVDLEKPL